MRPFLDLFAFWLFCRFKPVIIKGRFDSSRKLVKYRFIGTGAFLLAVSILIFCTLTVKLSY
jgi:hypothetical protein